jgi:hypothetical protein
MKCTLLTLCCITLALCVHAKGIPIIYGKKDKIVKVADLPRNDTYNASVAGIPKHFDIGFLYTKSHILFIPYSVSDGKYVGYIDNENYVELTPEEVKQITGAEKISLPSSPPFSFWDKTGGKIVFGILGLIILYGVYASLTEKKEEAAAETLA